MGPIRKSWDNVDSSELTELTGEVSIKKWDQLGKAGIMLIVLS